MGRNQEVVDPVLLQAVATFELLDATAHPNMLNVPNDWRAAETDCQVAVQEGFPNVSQTVNARERKYEAHSDQFRFIVAWLLLDFCSVLRGRLGVSGRKHVSFAEIWRGFERPGRPAARPLDHSSRAQVRRGMWYVRTRVL